MMKLVSLKVLIFLKILKKGYEVSLKVREYFLFLKSFKLMIN